MLFIILFALVATTTTTTKRRKRKRSANRVVRVKRNGRSKRRRGAQGQRKVEEDLGVIVIVVKRKEPVKERYIYIVRKETKRIEMRPKRHSHISLACPSIHYTGQDIQIQVQVERERERDIIKQVDKQLA